MILIPLIALAIAVTGCTQLEDYADTQPAFKLEQFFDGPLTAHGIFKDYKGTVIKRFRVDMIGSWEGNVGRLKEDFFYDDGTTEQRIWTITKTDSGHYVGTAADIKGEAIGTTSGFALNWQYVMRLPVGDTVYNLSFDDWMYRLDSNTVLNEASVSKLGVTVGKVVLVMHKIESQQ
ncbi:DUF3833 domain-containing protein [Aestuariicella hydrocarbonica]|uniref:DUF3833 domain-containing protein n=2 Tax=Pseudomaricurvus hydrocarbonicus TaxID=1470433 RepID=A0A9E5JTT2_9GAMM|nr:DUF3833 domain-containing protein [Aestuariicella hydrocarbonica]